MPAMTFTVPALRATYEVGEIETLELTESLIAFTFAEGVSAISYEFDTEAGDGIGDIPDLPDGFELPPGFDIPDFDPEMDVVPDVLFVPEPLAIELDGVSSLELEADGLVFYSAVGRVEWSGGSTVLLSIQLENEQGQSGDREFDYLVVLDGDPLPDFSSAEAFDEFGDENGDTFSVIPEGEPFGPGSDIVLASVPNVVITEAGPLPEPPTPSDIPTDLPDDLPGDETAELIDALGGDDTVRSGAGDDTIDGGEGDDSLEGESGNDSILGGDGEDTLDGGLGFDILAGGDGGDVYIFDGVDVLVEDPADSGIDEIRVTDDFALTLDGFELVRALGSDNIRLDGTPDAETLIGNAGRNILVGLGGDDTMTGGDGADTFVLTALRGTPPNVTVTDWSDGDTLAIDDQLLGIGERQIDPRDLTPDVFRDIRDSGIVGYNARTGELSLDTDGDGTRELVADLGDGTRLTLDDVLLF